MGFWGTIFVVLMILWPIGGGVLGYSRGSVDKNGNAIGNPVIGFGVGTLIPWACVAILGAVMFGGISAH